MSEKMPAVFVGHGNPMNTLETNRFTEAWSEFGASIETPRAILAISAHWYINATALTSMAQPRTIHDFYGFPDELFAVEYPAPGDPGLAAHIAEVVKPVWAGLDTDSWGIDHGTWSVLAHMFPSADVPVIQLSINANESLDYHVALGAKLDALRSEGVLVLGSGNVVHNLGMIQWGLSGKGADWAIRFDEAARSVMASDPSAIGQLGGHPDLSKAVPTPDHFIPLAYLAGLAAAANATAETFVDGYDLGSLSMTSYVVRG